MERELQNRFIYNATCININEMYTYIHFIHIYSLVCAVLLFVFTVTSCMIFCEPLCCDSQNRRYCKRRINPIQDTNTSISHL